jgi:transposase
MTEAGRRGKQAAGARRTAPRVQERKKVVVRLGIWRLVLWRENRLRGRTTTMERYIGIDVHSRSCTLAVMGPSGKRLGSEVVETQGDALLEAVRKVKGQRFVCIEEGTQSEWVHELLEPHVEDLIVIVPTESRGNKSDELDSWKLAETARVGKADKRVFKGPSFFASLRAACRAYRTLSKDVTRTRNRLKAVYRARGVCTEGGEVYRADQRERWLEQLPPSSRRLAELLGEQLDALVPLKERAEQWLNEEAKAHRGVTLLKGVPGFGTIRAAQVVAVIMTPHRFRTSRQLWSYSGLGVVNRTSADWVKGKDGKWARVQMQKTRGLNRDRNATLKSVFKSAATTVITRMTEHSLHKAYAQTVAAGTKPNLAKLTLARRLAAICLVIWKKQEYNPEKHRPRPNRLA